jgi:hypothetical protein
MRCTHQANAPTSGDPLRPSRAEVLAQASTDYNSRRSLRETVSWPCTLVSRRGHSRRYDPDPFDEVRPPRGGPWAPGLLAVAAARFVGLVLAVLAHLNSNG